MRYAFCPWLHEPLRAEIRRQFERFRELGFAPTYWDGHTHLHLHPTILGITLPIAEEYGFKRTRLVREPGPWRFVPQVFEWLSSAAIPRLQANGIGFADRVFGLRATGQMSREAFEAAFYRAVGDTEVYFHPGAESDPPTPAALAALLRRATTAL
jgi:predicted glycoside hydrolase/deacetylase ChbG (UPF0249 family)